MKLVVIAALVAICGAAKLDRTYLPPPSAATAGGNSDSLQTPFFRSTTGQIESSGSLPTGSFMNDFEGVVVDAATAGTRASSDGEQSGLGGPRESYGSENSRVGDAAFRGSVAGFRSTPTLGSSGSNGPISGISAGQNFGSFESKSERPQAIKDRNSNIITYANDVSLNNYNYGFESDNGIAVGENGVANNGIQAQGGYSYTGDDGQVYKVTYVADEGGYRPQGDHLPTPPPIPQEILKSLEQNAKEEAAGLVDDGSYDAQKYNAEGDYTPHNGGNTQYNGAQLSQFAKRPESDATSSNTFINQNSQAFGKPGQLGNIGAQSTHSTFNGQSNQYGSNFANNQNSHAEFQNKQSSHIMSEHQQNVPHSSGYFGQHFGGQSTSQFVQTQGPVGSQSAQFGSQNDQQASAFGTQSTQFGSQTNQQGSATPSGSQTNQVESATQYEAQPDKPSIGQNSNSAFNALPTQGTQFGNQASIPNGSIGSSAQTQNGFRQPSQYNDNDKRENSDISQTVFGNAGSTKPVFNRFGSNEPSGIGQGQIVSSNGNRLSNTQNQAEYPHLPPLNSNYRPANNKLNLNDVSATQDSNRGNQTPDAISSKEPNQGFSQGSSASAFASVGSAGLVTQPPKPLNTFQIQTFRPNQFNYNNNNQLTSQGQIESNTLPNPSQYSGSHSITDVIAFDAKPTSIPETELTTPLESFKNPDSSQGSQFNSQSAPSLTNTDSQFLNHQTQPQIGFQNNVNTSQQSTIQTSTSKLSDSRPQGTFQLDFLPFAPATEELGFNKQKTQFPHNVISKNQQNHAYYSTQKPSFSQTSDDSYYYNQPSKPFAIPTVTPQGPRFPSLPSYQSNGVATSQSNQFPHQQGSQTSSANIPISPSVTSAASTPSTQSTQNHGPITNYYNGITQASISSFPSVSSTTSSQFGTNKVDQFGFKPYSKLPSFSPQSNMPIFSQQNVSPFPPSYVTTFEQKPSSSFSQIQFEQSSLNNNHLQTAAPSLQLKPITSSGQIPSTSFTQQQTTNKDQPKTPETSQVQPTTSNQTQQYQGTIYEYNKPAEVLPAPEKTDSSSSQSVQTDQKLNAQVSKPQFEAPQTQFGQSTFSSQTQQYSFNQGSSGLPSNSQFGQNVQSALQQNIQELQGSVQSVEHDKPTSLASPQFRPNLQAGSESKPQIDSQPHKTFGSASSPLEFGQNAQQPQGTGHTSGFTATYQTQESQSGVQPFKPFGDASSTATQFSGQPNKPLGTNLSLSQFGQAAQNQGSDNNVQGSQIVAQPFKPFGTTGTTHDFQRYPSPKPQLDSQLTQTQYTQNSQQTFGATQTSSQPAREPPAESIPTKPFGNTASIHGSTYSQKPQFGQNIQFNQGTQASGQSFGPQSFQSSQFSSSTTKPQFDSQTLFGQNQNASPIKPFGNIPGQTQFTQNSAQASSSAVTQQQPQSAQVSKPFGASSNQGSSHSQNKPQFDQSPHSSLSLSTPSSLPQFGVQPFKPFSSFGAQSQYKPQTPQNKPGGSQQGTLCCQGSKDSSIVPLNIGEPSQAFSQTQSQFTGFQVAHSLNAQSVAGKGEEFGGTRHPPSFDAQSGYHY